METTDGDRIRGGIRSIQIRDLVTGVSQVIAEIKENAPGELMPPNRIVYRDAFNGIKADVVYVQERQCLWRNHLGQSTGNPSHSADPALMVYYVDFANVIRNAWFRWAEVGVEFYTNPGDDPVHELNNS